MDRRSFLSGLAGVIGAVGMQKVLPTKEAIETHFKDPALEVTETPEQTQEVVNNDVILSSVQNDNGNSYDDIGVSNSGTLTFQNQEVPFLLEKLPRDRGHYTFKKNVPGLPAPNVALPVRGFMYHENNDHRFFVCACPRGEEKLMLMIEFDRDFTGDPTLLIDQFGVGADLNNFVWDSLYPEIALANEDAAKTEQEKVEAEV